MKTALLLTLLLAGCLLPACQHELFMDANSSSSNRRIETFYDDDSAVKTREERRRAEQTGFGYPAGMFQQ